MSDSELPASAVLRTRLRLLVGEMKSQAPAKGASSKQPDTEVVGATHV